MGFKSLTLEFLVLLLVSIALVPSCVFAFVVCLLLAVDPFPCLLLVVVAQTPLFLLVLCLTIIGGLELFASIYVNTPGVGLLSLVVVDAHHPFAIKLLKSHTFFQCSCWKAFEVALATR